MTYNNKPNKVSSVSDSKKSYKTASCNEVSLYTPEQLYAIEKHWFDVGNTSYGLMQQAAWQIAFWINSYSDKTASMYQSGNGIHNQTSLNNLEQEDSDYGCPSDGDYNRQNSTSSAVGWRVYVWVGSGNNGGDGWLVASYLTQFGANVTVVEVGIAKTEDAMLAKQTAQQLGVAVVNFLEFKTLQMPITADLFIDALFGIGLDRMPENEYAEAIECINTYRRNNKFSELKVISIDIPSGLMAGTGQVFNSVAVVADVTLCLVARKLGLHLKDATDYTGSIIDIPLIPTVFSECPVARLRYSAHAMPTRHNNAHKGSFGQVLIVGGNQIEGSQGMGGAAILAASTAFATGVGKLTVACHKVFHSSLVTCLPNAMAIDLHDDEGVKKLIEDCDTLAIGMGLGRDTKSKQLFETYLNSAIENKLDIVIDADGLYHLASLYQSESPLIAGIREHAKQYQVWFTPHSGEAARILNMKVKEIEANRLDAINQLVAVCGGSWLLKGAGSLVEEQSQVYVCAAGNPGMATAGMGDVLSGLAVGLMSQKALPATCRSLQQAVMIHALAGDVLEKELGIWALQAKDMPSAVGHVLKRLTV